MSYSLLASLPTLRKEIRGYESTIRKNFLKKQKEFSRQLCKPGTEEKYWSLLKSYRGEGFYIPKLINKKLDRLTVSKNIPLIKEKIEWIDGLIIDLNSKNNFKIELSEVSSFSRDLKELLLLKERAFDSKSKKQRLLLSKESEEKLVKFKMRLKSYLKSLRFFHSFRFPVDHLNSRKIYDDNKKTQNIAKQRSANRIYFFRKLTEDGTFNKNYKRSDRFLRTLLNTTYLKLDNKEVFLSEDLRFDIFSLLEKIKYRMRAGVNDNLLRLKRWKSDNVKSLSFYTSLKKNIVKVDGKNMNADVYINELNRAKKNLEDFVLRKEALSYEFWSRESELYRALYVLTTILYNEVGRIDGSDALERKDVLHVVMNRLGMAKYNQIKKSEPLYSFFSSKVIKKTKKFPWLNVLFKEGEFSFTYYFISSSVRIFCPDMTRIGKRLRYKNLKLSLNEIKRSEKLFPGVRYFSRASMLGRIRMDSLWNDYRSLNERPGKKIKNPKRLKSFYYLQKSSLFSIFFSEKLSALLNTLLNLNSY